MAAVMSEATTVVASRDRACSSISKQSKSARSMSSSEMAASTSDGDMEWCPGMMEWWEWEWDGGWGGGGRDDGCVVLRRCVWKNDVVGAMPMCTPVCTYGRVWNAAAEERASKSGAATNDAGGGGACVNADEVGTPIPRACVRWRVEGTPPTVAAVAAAAAAAAAARSCVRSRSRGRAGAKWRLGM